MSQKMQDLLDKCPSHFEFYTVGDADIVVFDNRRREEIEAIYQDGKREYCKAVSEADADLGLLIFPNCVHSVSG